MNKFCILPFSTIRIEDNIQDDSSRFRPCCPISFADNKSFDSIEDYLNSKELKKLQEHLLTQPDLPKECFGCEKIEQAGQRSIRQLKLDFFKDQTFKETNIIELDIFPSNTCNLNCLMCKPKFSSSVGQELKRVGLVDNIRNFDDTKLALDAISKTPNLKSVNLAGGEIFYIKHALELINAIKHVHTVRIISNATIVKDDIIKLLGEIKDLRLTFSLDGYGAVYEMIRYPAKWEQVSANVIDFRNKLPNATINLTTTVQPLTVKSIFEWLNFTNTNKFQGTMTNIIGDPLSWQMLNEKERDVACQYILSGLETNKQLTGKQRVQLVSFAKKTIPSVRSDLSIRQKSIEKLSTLFSYRKINYDKIDEFLYLFPDFAQEVKSRKNI